MLPSMGARGPKVKENGVPGQQAAGLSEMGVPSDSGRREEHQSGEACEPQMGVDVGAEGWAQATDACSPSGAHKVRE